MLIIPSANETTLCEDKNIFVVIIQAVLFWKSGKPKVLSLKNMHISNQPI